MLSRRYVIVIEDGEHAGYSAYGPDLPGCVATGATRDECQREIRDAITFHLEGLPDTGEAIPEPSDVTATYVNVAT
jgi:predicted RNase H-like HicB family nuclease